MSRHLPRDARGRERGAQYIVSDAVPAKDTAGRAPVRRIVFAIESRDQGWSDRRSLKGTREGSWTWFEAVVVGAGAAPDVFEHGSPVPGPAVRAGEDAADDDGEEKALRRRRVATNIHAGDDWERQVVEWRWDAADKEEREWVRTLRPGESVAVEMWARYPQWANRVRNMRVDVFMAAVH